LFSIRPSSKKLSKASTNEANAVSLVDPLFQYTKQYTEYTNMKQHDYLYVIQGAADVMVEHVTNRNMKVIKYSVELQVRFQINELTMTCLLIRT
jgi:hypothetical protein